MYFLKDKELERKNINKKFLKHALCMSLKAKWGPELEVKYRVSQKIIVRKDWIIFSKAVLECINVIKKKISFFFTLQKGLKIVFPKIKKILIMFLKLFQN